MEDYVSLIRQQIEGVPVFTTRLGEALTARSYLTLIYVYGELKLPSAGSM